jgi:predicted phosphodiesterase
MRTAILSDIHGNPIALDAVLADIALRGGVGAYWLLGDYCAIGPDPAGVIERLLKLPNCIAISGNADRYVSTSDRPYPRVSDATAHPELIPLLAEVAGSFSWTAGHIESRGYLDWLRGLPADHRLTLPDGTRVLLVHAAPGTDDGDGLNPALTDADLEVVIAGAEANLICVGHFHMPMERRLNGVHMLNPGSVSNSFLADGRAGYAILTATGAGYNIAFHRVKFDREASIAAAERTANPGVRYVRQFLEGKVRAPWMDQWDGVSNVPLEADVIEAMKSAKTA